MVDVNAQIQAVDRSVRTEEQDGTPIRVQQLGQTYPSPIDDVWNAVTDPDRIARWFLPVEGEARLGGRYQLVGNAGGEVLACTPPAQGRAGYRITWEYGGGISWVEVVLQEVDERSTRLELTHSARADDVPEGFWELYGPGATGVGWDGGLLGLALHLSSDASVTPEDAEAWVASEEGRAFHRAAATAWGHAHAASGADPQEAARAADNTYAFFTGQESAAAE